MFDITMKLRANQHGNAIGGEQGDQVQRKESALSQGEGQGADLLETRGRDDLASGVIDPLSSRSSFFLTAAIW